MGVKKPLQLHNALLNRGLQGHTQHQLGNYLARLKERVQGPASMSYSELNTWCEARTSVPEGQDDVYVIHHEVDQQRGIRVMLSSKRLLASAARSK